MIKISDRWVIDADSMCYILKETKINQKGNNVGKEREEVKGYFSSVPEALKRIYDTEVMEKVSSTDLDLKSAIDEMNAIRERVIQDINKATAGMTNEKIRTDN